MDSVPFVCTKFKNNPLLSIKHVDNLRGRGVVALQPIIKGQSIFKTLPIMSNVTKFTAKTRIKKSKRKGKGRRGNSSQHGAVECQLCYRPTGSFRCDKSVCLESQEDPPEPASVYWDLLSKAQDLSAWKTLSRFQGLTTKLALLKLTGTQEDQSRIDALSALVHPRLDTVPIQWQEEQDFVLTKVLNNLATFNPDQVSKEALRFFTPQWYASVVGRLHLNAIRFRPHGSAVYGLPSFFNHSCKPNVVVDFDGARASFIADREIQEGEECLISYYHDDDSNQASTDIEEHLHWNYGFKCADSCTCGKYSSPG